MASEIDLANLSLPISNTVNKQLEKELHDKQKQIDKLEFQVSQHNDRIQVLSDHLNNVQQELQLSQALYEARKGDVETEKHLLKIAEREEGKLKDGCQFLKVDQEKLTDSMNTFENSIFKSNTKIEEIRKKMNLDQQALEAWLEESARRDEDALTITKYTRADENKIKELNLKLEQLHETYVRCKRALDNETMDTLTAQIELDKTAESYRQAHTQRQQLIFQWEQIIEQMKRRDEDVDRVATELARFKAEVRAIQSLVNEKKQFLEEENNNNKEMDKSVKYSETLSAKFHAEYQEKDKSYKQLKDELETLKYSVDRTAADLESMRGQNHHLFREVKDQNSRLDTLHHQRLIMAEEHKKSVQKTLSSEERAHKMDEILAEEESQVKKLEKEISLQREKQFKLTQKLNEEKRKKENVEAEIQSSKVALRNLVSKQRMVDEECLKQQEIIYMQDLQLQQLEHKLSRLDGERTEDEKALLTEKIKELENEWCSQHQTETLLQNQLKRLQDDLRRTMRDVEKSHGEKNILIGKIDELNLHIDSTKRESKKINHNKEDLIVDKNIIMLELQRLRDILFSYSNEIVSLEKGKLQLNTAMSERKTEINLHKEMLKTQIKTLETERQTISLELHDRISKVDKLKNRYEILTVSMHPSDGNDLEHSQTYYVIKAAQEREELQRQGDELDSKIRKAEREIQALENTISLMNSKNESFRKSLQYFDPTGEDAIRLKSIEGQLKAAMDKHRHKKKQFVQLKTDVQSLSNTLTTITKEQFTSTNSLESTKELFDATSKDISDIKTKMDRATNQASKLVKELRSLKRTDNKTDIENDIELRELRDLNSNILQELGTIANQNTNYATTIQLLLSQIGLPSISSSRQSSLSSSARSSLSSSQTSLGSCYSPPRQSVHSKPLELGITNITISGELTPHESSLHSSSSSRHSSAEKLRWHSKQSSLSPSSQSTSSRQSNTLDLTVRPS